MIVFLRWMFSPCVQKLQNCVPSIGDPGSLLLSMFRQKFKKCIPCPFVPTYFHAEHNKVLSWPRWTAAVTDSAPLWNTLEVGRNLRKRSGSMTQREVSSKGHHEARWKYNTVVAHKAVLTQKERPVGRFLETKLQYAIVILPKFHVKRNTKTPVSIL